MKTYLAGPIDSGSIKVAQQWRDYITVHLEKIDVEALNPFGKYEKDRLANWRKDMEAWAHKGDIKSIRDFVKMKVIPPDLKDVARCDFVTLYLPKKTGEVCGSYGEITLALYLNKPVYIVTRRKLKPLNIPKWAIGCSTKVFTDWKDYLEFVKVKYGK